MLGGFESGLRLGVFAGWIGLAGLLVGESVSEFGLGVSLGWLVLAGLVLSWVPELRPPTRVMDLWKSIETPTTLWSVASR